MHLWRVWVADPSDEFPDQWSAAKRIRVLGYDPMTGTLPPSHRNEEGR